MVAVFSNAATLIILLTGICFGQDQDLNEGDECSFEDGTVGKCISATLCTSTSKLGVQKVLEHRCGFIESQLLICCKPEEIKEKTTSTLTTEILTFREPESKIGRLESDRVTGEVSKAKCKEYSVYAYDKSKSPTLAGLSENLNTLECVFENMQLVAGGTKALEHEFPHIALIGFGKGKEISWSCGGSLVSEKFVLTAGHCLESDMWGPASLVRLGLTNQTNPHTLQELQVEEIIFHPEYQNKYHDIGLLKLSKAVKFTPYVRPACLQTTRNIASDKCIAAGWGDTEYGGDPSTDLLKIVLEFFNADECNEIYKKKITKMRSEIGDGIIDDLMICAGSSTEIKDTCQGDSGGPLQIYHNKSEMKCMYDIIGVSSFGKACGLAEKSPGVYTRVSAFIKWIEDQIWPN